MPTLFTLSAPRTVQRGMTDDANATQERDLKASWEVLIGLPILLAGLPLLGNYIANSCLEGVKARHAMAVEAAKTQQAITLACANRQLANPLEALASFCDGRLGPARTP